MTFTKKIDEKEHDLFLIDTENRKPRLRFAVFAWNGDEGMKNVFTTLKQAKAWAEEQVNTYEKIDIFQHYFSPFDGSLYFAGITWTLNK